MTTSATSDSALVAVETPLRRIVAAQHAADGEVDDVVQEALARLVAARPRLDDTSLLPFAVVTARNLSTTSVRRTERARRHLPRLIDRNAPERPDERAVRVEQEQAVREALRALPEHERRLLLAHEFEGRDTAALAELVGSTPGGVAARLARIRARTRVEYVLALRRVELPTARCKPILLALSAGDLRRQRALGAGRHLLSCAVCSSLSEPLTERSSALAGLLPWAGSPAAAGLLERLRQPQTALTTASVAAVAAAVAVGVAVAANDPAPAPPAASAAAASAPARLPPGSPTPSDPAGTPRSSPQPAPGGAATVSVDGAPMVLGPSLTATSTGQAFEGRRLLVSAVVADEGLWVTDGRGRAFVLLRPSGPESPQRVRPGQAVSVSGRLVAHRPGFAASVGVTPAEGAGELDRAGAHVEADAARFTPAR